MTNKHHQRGVTLVEVLVALSIFGFIAVTCTVLLRLGLEGDEQLREVNETMTEFHLARSLIKSDLAQITARKTRDEQGAYSQGAMLGGAYNNGTFVERDDGQTLLLSFTVNGRSNPNNLYPISSLEYVEYLKIEGDLVRRNWAYPDRFEDTLYNETLLFSGVPDLEISFLDGALWRDQWRSRIGAITPRALKINFTHEAYGPVEQTFFIEGVSG